MTGVAGKIWLL